MASIRETVEREVKRWPGVEASVHRFGGVEFRVNGHEIGHLHGDRMADLPLPVRMREELVESGKAHLHHVLPQTGWVSYYLRSEEDVAGALDLFKKNYDRLTARQSAGPLAGLSAGEHGTFQRSLMRVKSNLDPAFEAEQ